MKTLKQQLQEDLINIDFPAYCNQSKINLNNHIREIVGKWLEQKRQELPPIDYLPTRDADWNRLVKQNLIDELLEELK